MARQPYQCTKRLVALIVAGTISMASGNAIADDAVLEIEGTCPGQVRISWREAHPDRSAELIYGRERGVFVIPQAFPCAGTFMGVYRDVQRIHRLRTQSNGRGSVTGTARGKFCGGVLQMVILFPGECQLSNVADIP